VWAEAKEKLTLSEYKKAMKDVFSLQVRAALRNPIVKNGILGRIHREVGVLTSRSPQKQHL